MKIEKIVFTAMTHADFHALIIDAVNTCLRHHSRNNVLSDRITKEELAALFDHRIDLAFQRNEVRLPKVRVKENSTTTETRNG